MTFTQPYPYLHQGRDLLKIFLLIVTLGMVFEYLLIPFERDPDEHRYSYFIISLFHVGTAALCYLVFFYVLGYFVREEQWTFGKEMLAVALLLLVIGIAEWGIRGLIYNNDHNYVLSTLVEEVWHAYLSGGVLIVLVMSVFLNLVKKRNEQQALQLVGAEPQLREQSLAIKTQVAADDFILDCNQFLAANASGNYVELYLMTDGESNKLIKRITLTALHQQLAQEQTIFQTHRSYLVNLDKITRVQGNAQGYVLSIEGTDLEVPVSRKFIQQFNEAYQHH